MWEGAGGGGDGPPGCRMRPSVQDSGGNRPRSKHLTASESSPNHLKNHLTESSPIPVHKENTHGLLSRQPSANRPIVNDHISGVTSTEEIRRQNRKGKIPRFDLRAVQPVIAICGPLQVGPWKKNLRGNRFEYRRILKSQKNKGN